MLAQFTRSIGTLSWIDKRLYDPQDLPEVDKYDDPGNWKQRRDFMCRSGYRFANFLEGSVTTDSSGKIITHKFTPESDLYCAPSFRGIIPETYQVFRSATRAVDNRSVRFMQTVGCKTVSPEVLGAREGARVVDSVLGITPGWGGPIGVQFERIGAEAGRAAAENWRVFPPIWTELELTVFDDGGFSGRLLRYSLFPSMTVYEQNYTVEALTSNSTKYKRSRNYDARSMIEKWRATGWGVAREKAGACPGNPWGVSDPRLLNRDLPFRPAIPPER